MRWYGLRFDHDNYPARHRHCRCSSGNPMVSGNHDRVITLAERREAGAGNPRRTLRKGYSDKDEFQEQKRQLSE
jgi:hypothetical protein